MRGRRQPQECRTSLVPGTFGPIRGTLPRPNLVLVGAGEILNLVALAVIAIAVAIVLGSLSAQLFLRAADQARGRYESAHRENRR